VTKDGALSLSEFCTAMHLVVLRRNKIALPKQLPATLDPSLMTLDNAGPAVAPSSNVAEAKEPNEAIVSKPVVAPSSSAVQQQAPSSVVDAAGGTVQHWTKFVDSPTGSVASPGPQPVNFDFKRAQVEQDPRILHPVALRLTPESQQLHQSSNDLGPSSGAVSLPPSSSIGNTLGGALASSNNATSSSSMGKNSSGRSSGLNNVAPPAVPPRVSPSMVNHKSLNDDILFKIYNSFYSFPQSSPRKENEVSSQSSSGGAFQVYRRPTGLLVTASVTTAAHPASSDKKSQVTVVGAASSSSSSSVASKGLTSVIEDHQRRGEALRKQQQLLTKQLLDIQVFDYT